MSAPFAYQLPVVWALTRGVCFATWTPPFTSKRFTSSANRAVKVVTINFNKNPYQLRGEREKIWCVANLARVVPGLFELYIYECVSDLEMGPYHTWVRRNLTLAPTGNSRLGQAALASPISTKINGVGVSTTRGAVSTGVLSVLSLL